MMMKPKPTPRETPMRVQYARLKALYPDVLLLFRMGGFYELFQADARIAGPILDLRVTPAYRMSTIAMDMAGFPAVALDAAVAKLLAAGCKIAICEMGETK